MQKRHNGLEIRSKVWLEAADEPVFGRGRRFLLEAIDAHGSISRAAFKVGISYRKAWGHVAAMEKRLGIQLVVRQTGGRNGGGAALTNEARDFLGKFGELEQGLREYVDDRFRQLFAGSAKEDDRVRRAS